jgi:hypothetical protein
VKAAGRQAASTAQLAQRKQTRYAKCPQFYFFVKFNFMNFTISSKSFSFSRNLFLMIFSIFNQL